MSDDDFFNKKKRKPKTTTTSSVITQKKQVLYLEPTIIQIPIKKRRITSSSSSSSSSSSCTSPTTNLAKQSNTTHIKSPPKRQLTPPPIDLQGTYLQQQQLAHQKQLNLMNERQRSSFNTIDLKEQEEQEPVYIDDSNLQSSQHEAIPALTIKQKSIKIQIKFQFHLSTRIVKSIQIKSFSCADLTLITQTIAKKIKITDTDDIVMSYKGVKLSQRTTLSSLNLTLKNDIIDVWDQVSWIDRLAADQESKRVMLLEKNEIEIDSTSASDGDDDDEDEMEIDLESDAEQDDNEDKDESEGDFFCFKLRDEHLKEPLRLKMNTTSLISGVIQLYQTKTTSDVEERYIQVSFDGELLDPTKTIAYYINELDLEDGEMLTIKHIQQPISQSPDEDFFCFKVRDQHLKEPLKLKMTTTSLILNVIQLYKTKTKSDVEVVDIQVSFDDELLDPTKSIAYYIEKLDLEEGEMLTVKCNPKPKTKSPVRPKLQLNQTQTSASPSVASTQPSIANISLSNDTLLLRLKAGRTSTSIQAFKTTTIRQIVDNYIKGAKNRARIVSWALFFQGTPMMVDKTLQYYIDTQGLKSNDVLDIKK